LLLAEHGPEDLEMISIGETARQARGPAETAEVKRVSCESGNGPGLSAFARACIIIIIISI